MNMEATKTKQCNALRSASPSRWNVLKVKRRLAEAPRAGGGRGESRVRPVGAPVLPYGNNSIYFLRDHRPIHWKQTSHARCRV